MANRSRLKFLAHLHVGDVHFQEWFAVFQVAEVGVEVFNVFLRVEYCVAEPAPTSFVFQEAEDRGSYPLPSPRLIHCHSSNTGLGIVQYQAPGSP